MHHLFDVNLAVKYGVLESLLLGNLEYWIKKNEANGANFYDGRYWTYNSARAFSELFPYYSFRSIQSALRHLIDENLIITGRYGKSGYDRTLWYAFTEKGRSIMQNQAMDYAKSGNGLRKKEKCTICNNKNTIENTNKNTNKVDLSLSETCRKVIGFLNKKTGKVFRATSKKTIKLIKERIKEGYTLEDFFKVIETKAEDWGTDKKMNVYLRPETLFGNKFEGYLNQKTDHGKAGKSYDLDDFFTAAVEKGRKNASEN